MSKITVVALVGSPRKGGNTDLMTDAFLEGAKSEGAEVEKIVLDDLHIRPIGPVGDVWEEREDVRADDDAPQVLHKMAQADIVVFASPVYWQGVTAQMKCLIDRQSAYYMAPWLRQGMEGSGFFAITAWGAPNEDQSHWVTEPVKFWAQGFKARYLGEVGANVAEWGKVADMPGKLQEARERGAQAVREMRRS
ncbi:MAG: flavodoxin family protein [Armatimonadota bacterium]|nr:flavodoxin family protein [Armatimonadota bacterium]